MTFYCPIGQAMLNLVTNGCKLLKVNHYLNGKFLLLIKGVGLQVLTTLVIDR